MRKPVPPAEQCNLLEAAFGQEMIALQSRLRRFLRKLLVGLPDMLDEDLMQETFARAWRFRTQFDATRGSLAAWLMRIGFRTFLDAKADMLRQPQAQDLIPVETADRRNLLGDLESRERLSRLLIALKPLERDILLLFHREGQSVAEIAQARRLPEGTVKSHLHRARQRMWDLDRVGRDKEDQ